MAQPWRIPMIAPPNQRQAPAPAPARPQSQGLLGAMARDPEYEYGGILPFRQRADDPNAKAEFGLLYSDAIRGVVDAVTLPGRVVQGEDYTTDDVANMALNVAGGGLLFGGKPAGALGTASRSQAPIRAYHGSPHKFDKFDSSKIGTGEGPQGFGTGLYFTENPSIARHYQSKVSAIRGTGRVTIDGKEIDWDSPEQTAAFAASEFGGNREAAANFWERTFPGSSVPQILRGGGDIPRAELPGYLYEADLHADPRKIVDWDAPLSNQPDLVRGIANDADLSRLRQGNRTRVMLERWRGGQEDPNNPATGMQLLQTLIDYGGARNDGLSKTLLDGGFVASRHRDARGTPDEATNYVVIDPSIIEVIKRFGR